MRRRTELLKLLHSYIDVNDKPNMHVTDFGCGDGWYLQHFATALPQHRYYGTDISEGMIRQARLQPLYAQGFDAEPLDDDIPFSVAFDCVYSVTVFAHIMDSQQVIRSLASICNHLTDDGIVLLFEQTGPVRREWGTGVKRTVADYTKLAHEAGLRVLAMKHMTFPAHRVFETKIAPVIHCVLSAFNRLSSNPLPGPIRANKSGLYRAVSGGLLKLTRDPYSRTAEQSEGYTFFALSKRAS